MDGSEIAQRTGNTRVSRADWLDLAERVLVARGVSQIKVMALAAELQVSRSSFYWYFESRADLLAQLLARWEERNTDVLVAHAGREASSIWLAIMNVFECWIDPALFDPQLDFAVREWARRDAGVRARVDAADKARVAALAAMYERHGYPETEAFIRARVLYFMQIGYYALVENETIETRASYSQAYLLAFTGAEPPAAELAEIRARTWAHLSTQRAARAPSEAAE